MFSCICIIKWWCIMFYRLVWNISPVVSGLDQYAPSSTVQNLHHSQKQIYTNITEHRTITSSYQEDALSRKKSLVQPVCMQCCCPSCVCTWWRISTYLPDISLCYKMRGSCIIQCATWLSPSHVSPDTTSNQHKWPAETTTNATTSYTGIWKLFFVNEPVPGLDY